MNPSPNPNPNPSPSPSPNPSPSPSPGARPENPAEAKKRRGPDAGPRSREELCREAGERER